MNHETLTQFLKLVAHMRRHQQHFFKKAKKETRKVLLHECFKLEQAVDAIIKDNPDDFDIEEGARSGN